MSETETPHVMPNHALVRMAIMIASGYANKNQGHPSICSYQFEVTEEELVITSTNSYVLQQSVITGLGHTVGTAPAKVLVNPRGARLNRDVRERDIASHPIHLSSSGLALRYSTFPIQEATYPDISSVLSREQIDKDLQAGARPADRLILSGTGLGPLAMLAKVTGSAIQLRAPKKPNRPVVARAKTELQNAELTTYALSTQVLGE